MKFGLRNIVAIGLCCSLMLPALAYAEPMEEAETGYHKEDRDDCKMNVELTAKQKKKLDKQLHQMYKVNKAILGTYVECGAITHEHKKMKLQKMKHYMESVKKNGYHMCIEAEDDEIEYKLSGGKGKHKKWRDDD